MSSAATRGEAANPQAPDRRATLAIALAGVCAFLDLYSPQPLLPLFERYFEVSKAGASLTVSATTTAVALAAPLAGLVGERFGKKRVIVCALALLALPTLLAATARSLPELVTWRFFQGICLPGIFAVSIAYVTEEWPVGRVGAAMSAMVVGNVIGGAGGRIVMGLIAPWGGWQSAFVVIALLNLAGAAATWRWLPAGNAAPRSADAVGLLVTLLRHLRNRRLLAVYAVGFNLLFFFVATLTYVTFYLAEPPFRLSTAALSLIFVIYLVGIFTTPVAGRWIDRIGPRRALMAALLVAATGVGLTLVHHLVVVLAGLTLCSSAMFVCQSSATTLIQAAAAPGTRAAAAGLYVAIYYVGGSAGGLVPGFLWPLGGWPACVALVVAVQLTSVTIAALTLRDTQDATAR